MKSLVIAAISILASVQLCSADLFRGFIGAWNQEGVGTGTKITTIFKRFENKGMMATTTYVFPGVDKSVNVTRYYDNGTVKGFLKRNGVVQSKHSGTWWIYGQSLKSRIKVSAPLYPTFVETIKSTPVGTNKISTVSTSSNGVRSSATLTRK